MLPRLDHLADDEVTQVAVGVGDAAPHDPVDLAAREHELAGELFDGQVEVDVLAEPRNGDFHQNCSRRRMSLSQKARRS